MSEQKDFEFIDEHSAKDKSKMATEQATKKREAAELKGSKTVRKRYDSLEKKRIKRKRFLKFGLPLIIILLIVAAVVGFSYYKEYAKKRDAKQKVEQAQQEKEEKQQQKEELLKQNIDALTVNYLNAYASGDTENLVNYATPVTDAEKAWIKVSAKYTKEYSDVKVTYTEADEEGTYYVFATGELLLNGSDTTLPSQVCLLVKKTEDGTYIIDNAYSAFNQEFKLSETDDTIQKGFTSFVKSKQEEIEAIQKKQEDVISQNDDLSKVVNERKEALAEWKKTTDNGSNLEAEPTSDSKKIVTKYDKGKTVHTKATVLIRKKASQKSRAIATAKKHKELYVLGKTGNGWYYIKTGKVKGYILAKYCKLD